MHARTEPAAEAARSSTLLAPVQGDGGDFPCRCSPLVATERSRAGFCAAARDCSRGIYARCQVQIEHPATIATKAGEPWHEGLPCRKRDFFELEPGCGGGSPGRKREPDRCRRQP